MADGSVVKRRIVSQKVRKVVTRKIRRVGPDGDVIEDIISEEVPEGDLLSESDRSSSYQSSLSDARELTSPLPMSPVEAGSDEETERSSVRVYTDTIEGEPEVETDVQEFEETLPDGTVIKRKVIKTKQRQTIVKRVVMEGPETDLPTTEEQAQLMLSQDAFDTELKYSDHSESRPTSQTSVQEYEQVLDDGTVVKKKITTTKEEQLRTERTVLEGSSLPGGALTSPGDEAPLEASHSSTDKRAPPAPDSQHHDDILPDVTQHQDEARPMDARGVVREDEVMVHLRGRSKLASSAV